MFRPFHERHMVKPMRDNIDRSYDNYFQTQIPTASTTGVDLSGQSHISEGNVNAFLTCSPKFMFYSFHVRQHENPGWL